MRRSSPPAAPAEPIRVAIPIADLVAGLRAPGALGEEGPVEVIETHASIVFLAGRYAWKVKKPVRLWGLVDYGTPERRRACCEEEVRLGRRLAPEVYRGVARVVRRGSGLAVSDRGEALDHVVLMARIPAGQSLEERLAAGEEGLEAEVARVGEFLARFHVAHRLPAAEAAYALPSAFGSVLRQNFRATQAAVPTLFPAAVHEGLRRAVVERLFGARATIRRRVAEGRIVEGHGDLRLEHVVTWGSGIAVIDPIEFTPRLNRIDPLSDLAFLSMEFRARGRADLAATLECSWQGIARDPDADALLPLYRAYRAHVRAKVDHQVALDPSRSEEERARRAGGARRHLLLAWTLAREGRRPPIVLLRGPSGSGKSVVASAVAPFLGAEVLRSDVVRKALAGYAPTDRPEGARKEALYAPGMSARTYAALLDGAEAAVRAGRAVLLDATYLRRASRVEARERARALGAPFAILDVRCPAEVVRGRLQVRALDGRDASDADWQTYLAQTREAEPLRPDEEPFAVAHEDGRDPAETGLAVAERVEAQLRDGGPA
jgi:hypothetical protein